jgi:S-(hydroxymethyl)glutathione dehydrogenase/alcohol dehydrogenase
MTLDGIITHEFSLDDINIALDLMRNGDSGRILIKM